MAKAQKSVQRAAATRNTLKIELNDEALLHRQVGIFPLGQGKHFACKSRAVQFQPARNSPASNHLQGADDRGNFLALVVD
jgi:hypothetical protein